MVERPAESRLGLPVQLTSFIGREKEVADVERLLGESRLLTLTGSGGSGKTRLALEAASNVEKDYPDGAWWVDLAPLKDPALVPSTTAAVLAIREVPRQPLPETIAKELRDRRTLIVLDNCEHVVEACAGLALTILRSAPEVRVLATSRQTIDVEGEIAFRVPSLELPPEDDASDLGAITASEAVRLFVERAARARPEFRLTAENAAPVARICRRLDGIPLAIELAAARVRLLSVEQIADELGDVFHVLTGGARTAVPRHQTLRASVDWSYGLLTDDETKLLRRLAVFAGGFTLDVAQEVCSGEGIDRDDVLDLLSGLVDKSLVNVEESGAAVRYRLLESIRQYGQGRLEEAGEQDAVLTRHLEAFTALAERAEPQLEGPSSIEWIELLRNEHDNLRAALDWSLASRQIDTGVRLAAALRAFWYVVGFWSEAVARYEALLAEESADRAARARAFIGAASNLMQLVDWAGAYRSAEEAAAIARQIGDRKSLARGLALMGTALVWLDDLAAARPLCEEAIEAAREVGDRYFLSQAYWTLANGEWLNRGDVVRAAEAFERSLTSARDSGSTQRVGMALAMGGFLASWREPERAEPLLQEAVRLLEGLGEPAFRVVAMAGLAWIRLERGGYEDAAEHARRAVRLAADGGGPAALAVARLVMGLIDRAEGRLEAAGEHFEACAQLGRLINMAGWTGHLIIAAARSRLERGDLDGSVSALDEAAGVLGESRGMYAGLLAEARAELARQRGELEEAEAQAHVALRSFSEGGLDAWSIDVLELVAWSAAAHDSFVEAARLFGAAQAARDRLGYPRIPPKQVVHETDVELARAALGGDAFEEAWAEGAAMSLEDIVAYAERGRGERKRPSSGWASLTPTELEVAGLVAGRLTNPQIAEQMFVSRGTVKAHLSHIFAKLGISTRLELADQVAKHQTTS